MFMGSSSASLFISFNYMDVGIASTLLFVYPVMVAVIMALLFKEKVTPTTAVSIMLAFGGIALLNQSPDGSSLSTLGCLSWLRRSPTLYISSW
jgi:drug/metabolite transporter (DMT)-like permease